MARDLEALTQPLLRRDWCFSEERHAQLFDVALATAVNKCRNSLVERGRYFAIHRERTDKGFRRAVECDCPDLMACIAQMVDPGAVTEKQNAAHAPVSSVQG